VITDAHVPGRIWSVDEVYEAVGTRRRNLARRHRRLRSKCGADLAAIEAKVSVLQRIPALRADLDTAQRALRTATARVKR
jgi:hypothetical protein